MADLNEHLRWVDLVIDILAKSLFLNIVSEGLNNLEVDVGLKQGDANLLKHFVHVLLG